MKYLKIVWLIRRLIEKVEWKYLEHNKKKDRKILKNVTKREIERKKMISTLSRKLAISIQKDGILDYSIREIEEQIERIMKYLTMNKQLIQLELRRYNIKIEKKSKFENAIHGKRETTEQMLVPEIEKKGIEPIKKESKNEDTNTKQEIKEENLNKPTSNLYKKEPGFKNQNVLKPLCSRTCQIV
ncbi:6046_t:CDS:2 [Gigaspora margarita]|uniref:6046_t:CDS:1 n=1 Tax=Gigaspora margarita TaxID=4874 RepID=A0ABM8W5S6_GIGMA|nr:6046_t:CDS:2 [Gigaspora margarita]